MIQAVQVKESAEGHAARKRLHWPFRRSSRRACPLLVLFLCGWSYLLGCSRPPATKDTAAPAPRASAPAALPRSSATDAPPLAWLMSFPNSGTSYTIFMVMAVTGKNTATNYGRESLVADGTSVGVLGDSPGAGGPFWLNGKGPIARSAGGYLLTKTHCGAFSYGRPLEIYLETPQTFTRQCLTGSRVVKDDGGQPAEKIVSYDKEHVKRAVHLIRDPFDNVVSRFHLEYKKFMRKNETAKMALYPRTKEGFRAFCKTGDGREFIKKQKSRSYREVFAEVLDVPCHADFFRYVQWHNLAATTTWDLRLPTLVLHYENYTDDFNATKELLLDFLEQEDVHAATQFETGKVYREYFSEEEVKAVAVMFKALALADTWERIRHYVGQ